MGRLSELKSNGFTACRYRYDHKNRLIGRTYGNGVIASYAYDSFGRLSRLDLVGGPLHQPLTLAYEWDAAGQLLSRTWNGETQLYGYDPSGQLLSVTEGRTVQGSASESPTRAADEVTEVNNPDPNSLAISSILERYQYDMAGNMLSKAEQGKETTMAYDVANQLVSTRTGDQITGFSYDAAGRLKTRTIGDQVQTRHYGFLDKVLLLENPDGSRIAYDYYPDGHLAAKADLPPRVDVEGSHPSKPLALLTALDEPASDKAATPIQSFREELVWDGLALLYRNNVSYAVESHLSGGVPLVASRGTTEPPTYYISDILGTTLAIISSDIVELVPMTAFGKYIGSVTRKRITSESAFQPLTSETPYPGKNSHDPEIKVPINQ